MPSNPGTSMISTRDKFCYTIGFSEYINCNLVYFTGRRKKKTVCSGFNVVRLKTTRFYLDLLNFEAYFSIMLFGLKKNSFLILLHVFTWVFFLTLGVFFFTGFWPLEIAILRSIANGSLYALVFYGNGWVLFPKFIPQRKYFTYVIWSIILIATVSIIRFFLSKNVYGVPQIESFSRLKMVPVFFIFTSFIFMWFLSLLYKLSQNYLVQESWRQRIETQKAQAELQLLKSQVNPHFLFNTLNNLYSMAYRNDPRTADSIMSLSEMMRYMIYEASTGKVHINHELKFIRDFILLQELRMSQKPKIALNIPSFPNYFMIEPLLLIPFVENIFKHGNTTDPNFFADISIKAEQNKLVFTCINSVGNEPGKPTSGGFGLRNINQRLLLLYPQKHLLETKIFENRFIVSLTIDFQ